MATEAKGRVTTKVLVENAGDAWDARRGRLTTDQVRRIEYDEAIVDTGATMLSLPTRIIEELGLERVGSKRVRTSAGPAEAAVYEAVRLTIQGRTATADVLEVPDSVPVLVGQVPLELLDFVVDPANRRLIGNPEHGGEWIYESY